MLSAKEAKKMSDDVRELMKQDFINLVMPGIEKQILEAIGEGEYEVDVALNGPNQREAVKFLCAEPYKYKVHTNYNDDQYLTISWR